MFTPALRRHGSNRAFHDLQKRLLHAFTRHVPRDAGIVRLARDLVHFVDIDDPALRALHVVFRRLQQFQDDVFHIFPDIACLGQRRRIRHRERNIQNPRQRLCQQGLATARRADQQDIRLRQFDIGFRRMVQPFVMVVHRHRQNPFRVHLADHVIVQHFADVTRGWHAVAGFQPRCLGFLADDVHAEFDAFVTDEHGRPRDQLAHLVLAFAAKGTIKRIFAVAARIRCHRCPLPCAAEANLPLEFRPRSAPSQCQIARWYPGV